jgi:hypothetical protein
MTTEQQLDGAQLIALERARQVSQEGWTTEHDDKHGNSELAVAAECYVRHYLNDPKPTMYWPWERKWWKPKDDLRNLITAGALIAAEIDRLQRQNTP